MQSSTTTNTSNRVYGIGALLLACLALASAGCSKESQAAESRGEAAAAKVAGAPHVATDFYTVDAVAAPCKVGDPCVVTLKLVALGNYHVNPEYPFKVTKGEGADKKILAARDAFVTDPPGAKEPKSGTMTVKHDAPTAAGDYKLEATFSVGLCSNVDGNCRNEKAEYAVNVKVAPK